MIGTRCGVGAGSRSSRERIRGRSAPSSSARRAAVRISSTVQCCGWIWYPTLKRRGMGTAYRARSIVGVDVRGYLAEEIALDHADGLLGRRDALRTLVLMGFSMGA